MTWDRLRLAFVLVALVGCGKIESTPDEPSSEVPGPPGEAKVPAPDPGAAKPAAPRYGGGISMSSGRGAFFASAGFPFDPLTGGKGSNCTYSDGRAGGEAASASAGDIVIAVPARDGLKTSTVKFDTSMKSYETASLDAPGGRERLEAPGASIHVRAKGDAIPAFEANVLAAYDTSLIDPPKDAVISATSGDLVVRWTDAGNDIVFANLEVGYASVSCRFKASAKEGVIPAALVEKAIANAGGDTASCVGCVSLILQALRTTEITAGDFLILVSHGVGDLHQLKTE